MESPRTLRNRVHAISDESTALACPSLNGKSPVKEPIARKKLSIRVVRPSMLDIFDDDSEISKSSFTGLHRLLHIVAGLYLIANPLYNKYERGYFWEPSILEAAFSPFFILMTTWLVVFCWTFTVHFTFKIYTAGYISCTAYRWTTMALQLALPSGISAFIRYSRWSVFPSTFVLMVSMVHFMKMYSYSDAALLYLSDINICEETGFPKTDTLGSYLKYQLYPILVYETSYPQSPHKFRTIYFIHKSLHLAGSMWLVYLVSSTLIFPVFVDKGKYSFIHQWARMLIPLFIMDFLVFYMLFECILNMLAEITGFGDRKFYEDWWNCTTWEEYARKWNTIVHEFLLRHVYVPSLKTGKNKLLASVFTFAFSAVLHECFLAIALGFFKPYMFFIMMGQIPLIALSRYHEATTFGNYYFWLGVCVGVPGICVMYGREWANQ